MLLRPKYRLLQKVPVAQLDLVPKGYYAILPTKQKVTWLGDDLQADLYPVDWKHWNSKPSFLKPLQINGYQVDLPVLFCVGGKEDGETYYSPNTLGRSALSKQLLLASANLTQAYTRMGLLRAPGRRVCWPKGFAVEVVEDIYFGNTPVSEGQAEISPALAIESGMLKPGSALYGAWQIRGQIPLPGKRTGFIKGMVAIDSCLEHGMRLRKGALKLDWETRALDNFGF